jgi:hypothetical protein
MGESSVLPRNPEARTERVEDLVERVRRGLIRIPDFQRQLQWKTEHVSALFDSIYRGYPVGSLVFYLRQAPAERLELGPLVIEAPEIPNAWWVVDGQQRLATLAACLLRPVPLPTKAGKEDPFVLYFDAATHNFEGPTASRAVPTTWIPVPNLLDSIRLVEWTNEWTHRNDESLRTAAFAAGSRIREYAIPLYILDVADSNAVKEMFFHCCSRSARTVWRSASFRTPAPIWLRCSTRSLRGCRRRAPNAMGRCSSWLTTSSTTITSGDWRSALFCAAAFRSTKASW